MSISYHVSDEIQPGKRKAYGNQVVNDIKGKANSLLRLLDWEYQRLQTDEGGMDAVWDTLIALTNIEVIK